MWAILLIDISMIIMRISKKACKQVIIRKNILANRAKNALLYQL